MLRVALGLVVAVTASAPAVAQELRLELVRRYPSPTATIDGAALAGDQILVWARTPGRLYLRARGAWTQLCPRLSVKPIGAAIISEDTVEFLSAEPTARYRATASTCSEVQRLNLGIPVSQATYLRSGWMILGGSDSTTAHLWLLDRSGQTESTRVLAQNNKTSVLTAGSRGVTLSGMRHPFRWHRVFSGLAELTDHATPLDSADFTSPMRLLVGLGTFALDSGFLRVVADPRSDQRALVRFDTAGVFVKRSLLEVPWGIIATLPEKQKLLALENIDAPALLLYRWRWDTP